MIYLIIGTALILYGGIYIINKNKNLKKRKESPHQKLERYMNSYSTIEEFDLKIDYQYEGNFNFKPIFYFFLNRKYKDGLEEMLKDKINKKIDFKYNLKVNNKNPLEYIFEYCIIPGETYQSLERSNHHHQLLKSLIRDTVTKQINFINQLEENKEEINHEHKRTYS